VTALFQELLAGTPSAV